ncbi:MAG: hypothetical protein RL442_2885 [Pseudomonadota bacterium]
MSARPNDQQTFAINDVDSQETRETCRFLPTRAM